MPRDPRDFIRSHDPDVPGPSPRGSPAPWKVNASGGARTIVARDGSVVAIVMGCDAAAPFEVPNGNAMAAAPELLTALVAYQQVIAMLTNDLRNRLNEWKGFRAAQAAAEKAIAKAEGRQS